MPSETPEWSSVPISERQLSEFLLRACHDLRGPLRAIRTHSELLRRDTASAQGTAGQGPLDFIVGGATQASLLVDGLTDYSLALQIDPSTFRPLRADVILRTALAKLAAYLREHNAIVTYEDLPTVLGNADRLVQLFELLVDNAVRCRRQDDPRIHITAERAGGEWLFAVRDNCTAVEQEFLERQFKPFERIHGQQRPGPGLATCRIIVERHGGTLRAESTPEGNTFRFTLPADE